MPDKWCNPAAVQKVGVARSVLLAEKGIHCTAPPQHKNFLVGTIVHWSKGLSSPAAPHAHSTPHNTTPREAARWRRLPQGMLAVHAGSQPVKPRTDMVTGCEEGRGEQEGK